MLRPPRGFGAPLVCELLPLFHVTAFVSFHTMTPNPQVAQLTSLLNAHQAPEGVSSMEELHAWLEALPKHLCAWADSHKTDIFKVCSVLGG